MAETPNHIRREALRFLVNRSALPHPVSAVHSGLKREGVDATVEQTAEALSYLADKGWAKRIPSGFGGGLNSSSWQATAAGKDQNDEEP